MASPKIVARAVGVNEEEATERASTYPGIYVTVPYTSGATGEASVQIFQSNNDADRGGVVLRFSIKDGGCSFVPTAVHHGDGLDLHLAGEVEAKAFLAALAGLLAAHQKAESSVGVGI